MVRINIANFEISTTISGESKSSSIISFPSLSILAWEWFRPIDENSNFLLTFIKLNFIIVKLVCVYSINIRLADSGIIWSSDSWLCIIPTIDNNPVEELFGIVIDSDVNISTFTIEGDFTIPIVT